MAGNAPSFTPFSTPTFDTGIIAEGCEVLPLQEPWNVGPQDLEQCAFYHTMDLQAWERSMVSGICAKRWISIWWL